MFFVGCDRNGKKSQNVHNLIFCKEKIGFSEKNLIFPKTLYVAISLGKATKLVKLLKTFENRFFLKKEIVLSKKDLNVLKTAKCSKLHVERDSICKISQNLQDLWFFETEVGFWKNCFEMNKTCQIWQICRRMRQK